MSARAPMPDDPIELARSNWIRHGWSEAADGLSVEEGLAQTLGLKLGDREFTAPELSAFVLRCYAVLGAAALILEAPTVAAVVGVIGFGHLGFIAYRTWALTHPQRYQHWKLSVEGDVAHLPAFLFRPVRSIKA